MMTVEEAITGRRSIRAFLDTPVPRETIDRILTIASRAPSGSNIQPWKVWVLEGEVRKALSAELKAQHDAGIEGEWPYAYYPVKWRDPYLARRRACGFGLYAKVGIARGDTAAMKAQHGRNFLFFDAPVGLIFTIDDDMEVGSWLDYGMFLQSIMVAARAFGLETCPQAAFAPRHKTIKKRLGIPDSEMVVCGIALGYADWSNTVNEYTPERLPLGQFVHYVDALKGD